MFRSCSGAVEKNVTLLTAAAIYYSYVLSNGITYSFTLLLTLFEFSLTVL